MPVFAVFLIIVPYFQFFVIFLCAKVIILFVNTKDFVVFFVIETEIYQKVKFFDYK